MAIWAWLFFFVNKGWIMRERIVCIASVTNSIFLALFLSFARHYMSEHIGMYFLTKNE